MNKKKMWMGIGALAIIAGGSYYAVPALQGNVAITSEKMTMKEFQKLKDLKFEVLDTSSFVDKNMEKWFEENKVKEGEHLYFDNKYTYVLISPGKEAKKDETIWFDGLKSSGKDGLIVGYELVSAKELGISLQNSELRTLLVRTDGEFKQVNGLSVEKKKEKINIAPAETANSDDKSEEDKEKPKDKVEKEGKDPVEKVEKSSGKEEDKKE